MAIPHPGDEVKIKSLGKSNLGRSVTEVSLLGHPDAIQFSQDDDALKIVCPPAMPFKTAVAFKVK